jgi:ABC-2 type transport system permease protein
MSPPDRPKGEYRTAQPEGTPVTAAWTSFNRVFSHEARLLRADRSLWTVCGLLALLLGFGLFNGLAEISAREQVLRDIQAQQPQREAALAEQLQRVLTGQEQPDPFANPADPASVGSGMGARTAVLPYQALAPLALGQSDMQPNYYRVTYRSRASFMDDAELESPWHLLSGAFDPLFVLVYLLPLAVLALSWNLLSAEREQGTLKLLLSQPLTALTLAAGKLAVRVAALVATVAVVLAAVLLVARPELRSAEGALLLAAALGIVGVYSLFWFALALAVNALGRSSAFNALALVAAWVLLVLLMPVLMNLAVSAANPAPSRIELATRTRLAAIEGLKRYNALLSADYRYVAEPEVLLPKDGKIEVASRRRAQYLVGRDTDREIEALLVRFDEQLAGQQALVDRWSWLSPALVAHEALTALAGTGSQRYLRFRQSVQAFHGQWKAFFEPRLMAGTAMSEADLQQMPRFSWAEPGRAELNSTVWRAAIQLFAPTLLLAALASAALRRFRVV